MVLQRQDLRGADWGPKAVGHWEVRVTEAGEYDITIRFKPHAEPATVRLAVGDVKESVKAEAGAKSVVLRGVKLPKGDARLTATVGDVGVMFVEVSRR